jgi:hypothetical protein
VIDPPDEVGTRGEEKGEEDKERATNCGGMERTVGGILGHSQLPSLVGQLDLVVHVKGTAFEATSTHNLAFLIEERGERMREMKGERETMRERERD